MKDVVSDLDFGGTSRAYNLPYPISPGDATPRSYVDGITSNGLSYYRIDGRVVTIDRDRTMMTPLVEIENNGTLIVEGLLEVG